MTPGETWEEGLLCGNGTIGANALSRPLDEIVIFTHERMYLPENGPETPPDLAAGLPEIRELIEQRRFKEAHGRGVELSGRDTFRYPDPFVPAFNLHIVMAAAGKIRDYWRSVDFSTGVATVHWVDDRGEVDRRLFVSRADGIAVLEIVGRGRGRLSCSLRLAACDPAPAFQPTQMANSSEKFRSLIEGVQTAADPAGRLTFACRFTKAYAGSIQSLDGVARVAAPGAEVRVENDRLIVSEADRILVLVGIDPVYEENDSRIEALKDRLDAVVREPPQPGLAHSFSALLERHAAVHGDLFGRVILDIGGGDDCRKPTEELIAESSVDNLSPALVEKVFDAGRYNIISSTGQTPPNLQGVWSGTYCPLWSGGYTQNGNLPSAIAHLLRANTPELMRGYIGYIESLECDMKLNARNLFGARGYVLPNHTSSHASSLLPFCFGGSAWTGGAPWAARFFYDTYLYTGEEEFLIEHALPFMEQAALFFEDFLYEGPDGKLMFNPSVSPENWPANGQEGVQPAMNATMEVAAVRELLRNLISASRRLGCNSDRIPTWEAMLARLPDYMLTDQGMVKEWLHPELDDNLNHRHSSQLYPLFDGLPEEIEGDPRLMEGFRRIVAHKLEHHYREAGFMAFGVVQLGLAATSLGESELAYRCLAMLANAYWGSNLASMHNVRHGFNMDISGGLPALVLKMLVDSRPGYIRLLPALPKEWPSGILKGALCRGQIEVQELRWEPGKWQITLCSGKDQATTLVAPAEIESVRVLEGEAQLEHITGDSNIQIMLSRGQKVTIEGSSGQEHFGRSDEA